MKFVTTISALVILATILSCGKKIPKDIVDTYSNYYISANADTLKKLSKIIKTQSALSEVINLTKNRGKFGEGTVELSDINNNKFTIGFSTPKEINTNKLKPLIIYLHGGTGTTRKDKGKHAWDQLSFLQDTLNIFLASPSANRETPWWSRGGFNRIEMTLRYMLINYPIDPNKIFLAGVSDGGSACYAVANSSMNSLFAGFFAISGFGELIEILGIPLSTKNLSKCNIYNINATNDRLYPIERVKSFLTRMDNSGVKIKQKIYKDQNHGFEYKLMEKDTLVALINRWEKRSSLQNLSLNKPTIQELLRESLTIK